MGLEFWGVEVKGGEPLLVQPGPGMIVHLSQVSLGEVKKDKGHESVNLFVNVDGKKIVLGTLSSEKLPQQLVDLVFSKDFELTHNWKNGSVFFCGYKTPNPCDDSDSEDEYESGSEEDIPLVAANTGIPSTQIKEEKTAAGKQKVKIVEPNKDVKSEDDDDSSDEDGAMSMDDSEDDSEDSEDDSDDNEDEDDSHSEEDEETPKKAQPSKRALESATKTPGPDKKAKLVTPKKTGGKKGSGHVATPYPSKQAVKTTANKSSLQTPKSEGSHSCKPCNRSFKTEIALDSHNKAKHGAGK